MRGATGTSALMSDPIWFTRLPGHRRTTSGVEWAIARRLPAILLAGTVLPLAVAGWAWWFEPATASAAEHRETLRWLYMAIGAVILHWTLVSVLAIGCLIVIVMKGPAYVADRFPIAGSDRPAEMTPGDDAPPR